MPRTLSPLRYPGGKTQLANFVTETIRLNNIQNCTYIEPYSGGFGAGLDLLFKNQVNSVVINDYDRSIYSIWYSILNHTEELIDLIEHTPITIDSWYEQKEIHHQYKKYRNSIENGFSTLFLNRTNRSGIINAGPIGGYKQDGKYLIDCRFNREDLINKILTIAEMKDRITLYQKDAIKLIDIIKIKYTPENSFIFFDPPYFEQGQNLYTNFYKPKDHKKLAKKISELENYFWITTYDFKPQIHDIYNSFPNHRYYYELFYSVQNKRKAKEFIFSSEKTILHSLNNIELTPIN